MTWFRCSRETVMRHAASVLLLVVALAAAVVSGAKFEHYTACEP